MIGNQRVMQKTFVETTPEKLDNNVNDFRLGVFVVASTTSAISQPDGVVLFMTTLYYEQKR